MYILGHSTRRGAAVNDLQSAVLSGALLFAAVLVANALMVVFGVASPILGSAEQEAIMWVKQLVAGLVS